MHAAAAAVTSLAIAVAPSGGKATQHWTLRCGPAGGTLPHAARACARLGRLDHPFAPVPPGVACSQIFSGPQEARVVGRYRGRRVWARFNRRNSCQTARWHRIGFLFPGAVRRDP